MALLLPRRPLGAVMMVMVVAWALLVVAPQASTGAPVPLCAKPVGGCAKLSKALCPSFSGCAFNTVSKKCATNTKCDEQDCRLKDLALRAATNILPGCITGQSAACAGQVATMALHLKMSTKCGAPTLPDVALGSEQSFVTATVPAGTNTFFVDPTAAGSDANSGTSRESAFQTIARALTATRALAVTAKKTIVIMAGVHRLTKAVELTWVDSNLKVLGETGAVVSGALDIAPGLTWTNVSPTVLKATLPPTVLDNIDELTSLFVNNVPMVRARWPNIPDMTATAFSSGKTGLTKWVNKVATTPRTVIGSKVVDDPLVRRYTNYSMGFGGQCAEHFAYNASYFCGSADADGCGKYQTYGGVSLTTQSVNRMKTAKWTDPSTAFMSVMHPLYWGGWTFKVGSLTAGTKITFDRGGFQEARGSCGKGGGDFFVENVYQLLDTANEFFVNRNTGELFYIPASPANNPVLSGSVSMELTSKTESLFRLVGNSSLPVRNVTIGNVAFEKTYSTFMSEFESPSGGDVTFHRGGTVVVEGAENVVVADCSFRFLGSNALLISKYAREIDVLRNVFEALDENGIVVAGDPLHMSPAPWDRRFDDEYVQHVRIRFNTGNSFGRKVFQSSAIFLTLAKDVLMEKNVFFTGPRAGICYNDVFGGGLNQIKNIMFNFVVLTLDQGPFTQWDRQRWLLKENFLGDNLVMHNYYIAHPNGPKMIDLDDGVREFDINENVVVGGFMKLKGHNVRYNGNVIVAASYDKFCVLVTNYDRNPANYTFQNNVCFLPKSTPYAYLPLGGNFDACPLSQLYTSGNQYFGFQDVSKIYTQTLLQSAQKLTTRCGGLSKWKSLYQQDVGSTFASGVASLNKTLTAVSALVQKIYMME